MKRRAFLATVSSLFGSLPFAARGAQVPSDSNGNYSLPASYHVQNGDTVLPVQHNVPFEDVANALSNRLMKDGRTVMTGNLQMGGFRPVDRSDEPFATVADLLADTQLNYGSGAWGVQPGRILEAQGFRYEVVAGDATEFDEETAGGLKLLRLDIEAGGRRVKDIAEGVAFSDATTLSQVRPVGSRFISGGEGAWSWFADPRAIFHDGKTFFASIRQTESGSDTLVSSFDHSTGEVVETVIRSLADRHDDHDVPSLLALSDGRIAAFYPFHSGDSLKLRISFTPGDISSFGSERTVNAGVNAIYPNPVMLSGEGDRIYVFFGDRSNDRDTYYTVSNDQCATFSAPTQIISGEGQFDQGIYYKVGTNGVDRIDIALTGAEGGRADPKVDIRHFSFSSAGAVSADGTSLGSLPLDFSDIPPVFLSSAHGDRDVWVADCSTNNGFPQIVYAEFPSVSEHRYRYARFNGTSWDDVLLTAAGSSIATLFGEGYYHPGIALDHDRDGEIYLAVGNTQTGQIQRWQRNGGDWQVSLVSQANSKNMRPVVPRNSADGLAVLWMSGQYEHYTRFGTRILGAPRGGVAAAAPIGPTRIAMHTPNAPQAGGSGWQVMPFDRLIDSIDTNQEHDPSTYSVKLLRPGVYAITIAISLSRTSSATGQVAAELRRNGARLVLFEDKTNSVLSFLTAPVTMIECFEAGDVLDVRLLLDDNANISGSVEKTFWKIHQLQ